MTICAGRSNKAWVVLLIAGAASGCATSQRGQVADDATPEPPGYFAARAREFGRIFEGELLFGPGLGIRASATKWCELGCLFVGSTEAESHVLPVRTVAVGKRGDDVGSWQVRAEEYGVTPWFHSDVALRPLDSLEPAQRISASAQRGSQLSAQVHLGVVGAELGFDPVAFGQFVVGLFGFADESPGD